MQLSKYPPFLMPRVIFYEATLRRSPSMESIQSHLSTPSIGSFRSDISNQSARSLVLPVHGSHLETRSEMEEMYMEPMGQGQWHMASFEQVLTS